MLIDQLRGMVRSGLDWKKILMYGLPIVTFIIGLMVPSPLYDRLRKDPVADEKQQLVEVTGMIMADGSRYDGSIIKGTKTRHGFGRLTTADSTVYEGNWRNDELPYGQRTSQSSVYRGKFDKSLNNEGFGIIEYSDAFVNGKRMQGKADCDIVRKYIGNWHKNAKEGLGRSVKMDGSMEFGRYKNGIFQAVSDANYRVGGSVYGIDLSHYQSDVDWGNFALYCDKNGNVYNGKPEEKKYMQPVFFVYLKATEGATVKDDTYGVRATEAERHGILKGAYHFLHLGSPIEEQVKNFVETANWTPGDMPPALDIEVVAEIKEYGKEFLVEKTLQWLREIESTMNVRPIIYTRENIRNQYLNDERLKMYDFWIARYSEKGPDNFDWHLWQRTDKGVLEGYDAGRIDINLFKGNYISFMKYVNNVIKNNNIKKIDSAIKTTAK